MRALVALFRFGRTSLGDVSWLIWGWICEFLSEGTDLVSFDDEWLVECEYR